MDNTQLQHIKAQCLQDIRDYLPRVREQLSDIDVRLWLYASDAVRTDMDTANIYELLGIRKVLRLITTYSLNVDIFHSWLRAIEGTWEQQGENWQHVSGGLKFSTPRGARHVRLMPFQTWIIFGMYAFEKNEPLGLRSELNRELEPTEYVDEDGIVWDVRRLCRESHVFITRKAGKTELGAAIDVVEVTTLGPMNAQVHIVGNSSDQAKKIAYKAVKNFLLQLDPKAATNRGQGKYMRVTENDGAEWKSGYKRTSSITPLPAGGKPKDGTYDSLVHIDERGQATYVNERSDMEMTAQTCIGSMGPRREKMTLTTTTAGHCHEGPYQLIIRTIENQLLEEMDIPLDGQPHVTDYDHYFALLLRLDPWEITDNPDDLMHENLYRKVNRSIGITVQPSYYRERLQDARNSQDTLVEVLTKDFNIWRSENVTEWIQPEQIRKLQIPMTIEDCTADEGWIVFVGQDFSMGDDLHAQSYLAWRENPETGQEEFFADMDAWCTSSAVNNSPLRNLLQSFADKGHLHIIEGETLEPEVPVERLIELYNNGVTFMAFGYDPYKAKTPINALKAWIFSEGSDPKDIVTPVRQNFATYNPLVEEMDYMIKAESPLIRFSNNIMWPFEFGNVVLAESNDGMENKKPLKRDEHSKIDNVQALLSALSLFDLYCGKENPDNV